MTKQELITLIIEYAEVSIENFPDVYLSDIERIKDFAEELKDE